MAVVCMHECVLTERRTTSAGFTVGASLKSRLQSLMQSVLAGVRGLSTSSVMVTGTSRSALHRMPPTVWDSFRQETRRCFQLSTSAFFQVSLPRVHVNRTATHVCSRVPFTGSGFAARSGPHETLYLALLLSRRQSHDQTALHHATD
jgi:hypothetical protein